MEQRQHRHSWPEKDSKRQLSPHPIHKETKKVRSIYITESPGGTLRETSPTKVYQPDMQKLRISSLPVRPATKSEQIVKSESDGDSIDDEPRRQLSVRDTLFKGIAIGLNREMTQMAAGRAMRQHYPLLNHYEPLQPTTTIEGAQKDLDRAVHLAYRLGPERIEHDAVRVQGQTDAVHPILTDKRPGNWNHPSVEKLMMAQHFWQRRFYATAAGERLQAHMGAINFNPFIPPMVEPSGHTYQQYYMQVQEHKSASTTGQRKSMTLLDRLLSSSHSNGYKKLEIESLVIKKASDKIYTTAGLGSPGGTTLGERGVVEETLMEIDTMEGGINLYETNIIDEHGAARTWMWFKITKPLFSIRGRTPQVLRDMPESSVVFAVPTLQIMKAKEE
ncbi:Fc.00g015580.m01.CDS01 [Cosmosporella sp. VM-42]